MSQEEPKPKKPFEVIGSDKVKEVQAESLTDATRQVQKQVPKDKVVESTKDGKVAVKDVVQG